MKSNGVLRDGSKPNRLVRFGAFELFLDTGELRKHGVRVRLQAKPFHVLTALLEQPGKMVTRDQLRAKLWPSDTFVDFESGLNTAVNRLRIALGESADSPIYIETLARLGYRFIAPVEILSAPNEESVPLGVTPTLEGSNADESVSVQRRMFLNPRVLWYASAGIVILVSAVFALRHSLLRPAVTFQQLTFQQGWVSNARFDKNGKQILYSAAWNGNPSRVFISHKDGRESRELGSKPGYLASVSPKNEAAIYAEADDAQNGSLLGVPLSGGAPHPLKNRAMRLDFGPQGDLCAVVAEKSRIFLEYPAGHRIYRLRGWISDVRVSPDGRLVAFAEHLVPRDDAGQVVVVDAKSAQARVLSPGWESLEGLAWHPSGREIWFTAARAGIDRALQAVDLNGKIRTIAEIPGGLILEDISAEGKILITEGPQRISMLLGNADTDTIRDISWFDWSHVAGISADGKYILFDESGAGGGREYTDFLYSPTQTAPQQISHGRALDLSPDGQWVLSESATDATSITLFSLRNRTSWRLSTDGISYDWAKFIPKHQEILFAGKYPNRDPELFRQALPDGLPVPIHQKVEMNGVMMDPDGTLAIGASPECRMTILDLSTNEIRTVPRGKGYYPSLLLDKDQALASKVSGHALSVELLDLRTGRPRPYRSLTLPDRSGVAQVMMVYFAADRNTFVYSSQQTLSNLFLVSGWQ